MQLSQSVREFESLSRIYLQGYQFFILRDSLVGLKRMIHTHENVGSNPILATNIFILFMKTINEYKSILTEQLRPVLVFDTIKIDVSDLKNKEIDEEYIERQNIKKRKK